jgi:hypothetical protein
MDDTKNHIKIVNCLVTNDGTETVTKFVNQLTKAHNGGKIRPVSPQLLRPLGSGVLRVLTILTATDLYVNEYDIYSGF